MILKNNILTLNYVLNLKPKIVKNNFGLKFIDRVTKIFIS